MGSPIQHKLPHTNTIIAASHWGILLAGGLLEVRRHLSPCPWESPNQCNRFNRTCAARLSRQAREWEIGYSACWFYLFHPLPKLDLFISSSFIFTISREQMPCLLDLKIPLRVQFV